MIPEALLFLLKNPLCDYWSTVESGMLLPERTMLHLVLGFRTISWYKKEQKNNRNVIMSTYLVLPLSDSLCQEYLKEPF